MDGDKVKLRRKDGREISVAVAQLSDADQRYLQAKFKISPEGSELIELEGVETYRDLDRYCDNLRSAEQVVAAFQAFSNIESASDEDKERAAAELPKWEDLTKNQAARLGRKWLTPTEIEEVKQQEFRLIREAHRLIDVSSDELARERFEEASKANEQAVRADFYLGILHALVGQSPHFAEQHFDECTDRLNRDPDLLVGSRRINYVAALNNLALAQVRLKRFDQAVKSWAKAIEISPRTPELVQNLGRMTQLGASRYGVSKRAGREAGSLYASACVANNSATFDSKVGWLYMPFSDSVDGSMDSSEDEELHPVSHATCFAVASNMVLAPANAINDATKFRLSMSGGGNVRTVEGEIAGVDRNSKMVLLRFQGLNATPLAIAPDEATVAKTYKILGVPLPGRGNGALNAVETTVVDLQSSPAWSGVLYAAWSTMLNVGENAQVRVGGIMSTRHSISSRRFAVHNKIVGTGYIGAPLVNENGHVVAIHVGSPSGLADTSTSFSAALASTTFYPWIASIDAVELADVENGEVSENQLAGLGAANPELSKSVFQLTGLKNSPRLKWSHRIAKLHTLQRQTDWTSFEDRTCMLCGGRCTVPCDNRKCRNGTIVIRVPKTYRATTGETITTTTTDHIPCKRCRGKNHIKCPNCRDGIDSALR